MELRYPSRSIREHAAATRRSFEHIARGGDQELLATAIKTLQVDIDSIQRVLPLLERRLSAVNTGPLKVRSIHRWLDKKLEESIAFERELLAWRMAFVERFEAADAARQSGE